MLRPHQKQLGDVVASCRFGVDVFREDDDIKEHEDAGDDDGEANQLYRRAIHGVRWSWSGAQERSGFRPPLFKVVRVWMSRMDSLHTYKAHERALPGKAGNCGVKISEGQSNDISQKPSPQSSNGPGEECEGPLDRSQHARSRFARRLGLWDRLDHVFVAHCRVLRPRLAVRRPV